MHTPSRSEFPERVAELVRARFPLALVEPAKQHFSIRLNGHLASLENLYRLVAQQPEQLEHHVERWVVELLRAAEGRPDESAPFEDVRDRILPMLLPERRLDSTYASTVSQPLIEGLRVGYAIDADRTITYIPKAQFERWKLDIDDLHQQALANLEARSSPLPAHAAQDEDGTTNLIIVQTMDGYDASRLLLPRLHEQLKTHLGSPFLAGVPNRDILICFRDDAELVGRIRTQIAADFNSMPHQLTDDLFLVTPDGIAPYLPA